MLCLIVESNDLSEEYDYSAHFDAGWTVNEVEDFIEKNNVDPDDYLTKFDSPLWEEETADWNLSEKENLCILISSFSGGGEINEDTEKALFLYLENGHFNAAYIDSFENDYLGKYTSEGEYALESNSALVAAVEAVGFTRDIIDEEYLAKEYGADYTFEATGGGVYCFSN